jgi:hypothetical protein
MLLQNEIDASYLALLAGLWAEMEAIVGLHYTEDAFGPGAPERVGLRVEALLLEIDLLRGRCECMHGQGRLAAGQADKLRAMLAELEELLDDEPLGNPLIRTSATIVRAQNRLFDELRRAGGGEHAHVCLHSVMRERCAIRRP